VLANPDRSRPTLIEDGATGRTVARVPTDGEAPAREQLETTVRAFEEVAMSGSVELAPTAKLHLGWMERLRGRHEVALRLWREVLQFSKDRSTRFLAMVFSGRAFFETARWDEAAEMFRAALALEPRAQSAAVALAAVLLAQNRADDAATVIERSLEQAADARDPWWGYLRGAFDEWPNRLQALRAQLR
jgi:predicted Zn-dependent protease